MQWNVLRRLGSVAEINRWVKADSRRLPRPGVSLQNLNGWDLRYVTSG